MINKAPDVKLILESGEVFEGVSFGKKTERVTELVFNTSCVGYQEILSDPSYTDQTVVMTYPLIGNYGMCDDDYETLVPSIGGLAVRDYNDLPSNFRATKTLSEVMEAYGIPGISGVDTRRLTRLIRDKGSCRAVITDISTPVEKGLEIIKETPVPHDAVSRVSTKSTWTAECENARFHVAALDFGMKRSIIRSFTKRGVRVTVLPYDTDERQIDFLRPDGVFLSNGPGDPEDVRRVCDVIRSLREKYPMFGICLGHQLLALSYGCETYKLKFGHRGGNHPVKRLSDGKIEITSQNHSYAVKEESIAGTGLEMTHVNLLDHTVEGLRSLKDPVFSVQYHPESAPGPCDSGYLFDLFIERMKEAKEGK